MKAIPASRAQPVDKLAENISRTFPCVQRLTVLYSKMMLATTLEGRDERYSVETLYGDIIMSNTRDTYKYQFKIGNKIVHGGINNRKVSIAAMFQVFDPGY